MTDTRNPEIQEEASYYFEDGLRKVKPYFFVYQVLFFAILVATTTTVVTAAAVVNNVAAAVVTISLTKWCW